MVNPMSNDVAPAEVVSADIEAKDVLNELCTNVSKVEAAMVATAEGLPIAEELPDNVDNLLIGAMTAAVLAASARASEELQKGHLSTILIQSEEGMIFIKGLENGVLTVLAKSDVNIGLVMLYMEKACKKIEKIISTSWMD